MKFYLYDRQEAIENRCYKNIHSYKKFINISLLGIKGTLIIGLGFLIAIVGILIEFWTLAYLGLILLPILFLYGVIVMPIIYVNDYKNCKIWLYRAIVKDTNSNFFIVEQKDKLAATYFINEKDIFKKIFNKEIEGIITELNNIKLIKETKKYYICTYVDQNNSNQTIKIVKAYKNLKEVL